MPELDRPDLSGPTMDRMLQETGWTATSILSATLGDRHLGMARLRGRRSLDHLHVTADDWLTVEPPPVPGMRADVALRMLGLAPDMPWQEIGWPKDGPFFRGRDEGTDDRVSWWEMAQFRASFVSEGCLASELSVPPAAVAEVLRASGATPAVDPESIGAVLYRRTDLPDALRG